MSSNTDEKEELPERIVVWLMLLLFVLLSFLLCVYIAHMFTPGIAHLDDNVNPHQQPYVNTQTSDIDSSSDL